MREGSIGIRWGARLARRGGRDAAEPGMENRID